MNVQICYNNIEKNESLTLKGSRHWEEAKLAFSRAWTGRTFLKVTINGPEIDSWSVHESNPSRMLSVAKGICYLFSCGILKLLGNFEKRETKDHARAIFADESLLKTYISIIHNPLLNLSSESEPYELMVEDFRRVSGRLFHMQRCNQENLDLA